MSRALTTPATITTAAVLLFIYGGLLLTCGACGAVGGATNFALKDDAQQKRLQEIMEKEAPGNQIVGYANLFLDFVLGLAMIAAGVGVLKWSQGARFTAYAAIVLELLLACGIKVYQAAVVMPATQKMFAAAMEQQQKAGAPPPPFDIGGMMASMGAILYIVIFLVQLAILIPAAICLSTAGARAAFSGQLQAEADKLEAEDHERRSSYDDDDGYGAPKPPKNPGDTGIQT